jgi:hypothetical protein
VNLQSDRPHQENRNESSFAASPVLAVIVALLVSVTSCASNEIQSSDDNQNAHSLAGLWPYDPETPHALAMAWGVLVIEPPCVYVDMTYSNSGGSDRMFVRLPESLTRFDPASNSVWVDGLGPMTSGDHVRMGGGVGVQSPNERVFEGACLARMEFRAGSMRPWTSVLVQ